MRLSKTKAARPAECPDPASPYPDFVGALGQENTPPGGRTTVYSWIDTAAINRHSLVLDLACSTGFSGREVHADTGATVHGIDISPTAVAMARRRAHGNELLTYQVADASCLPLPASAFTHVLAGCNFGFIHERGAARAEVARVLAPGGLMCVSSFYYTSQPSVALLDKVESAIGLRPDPARDYSYWRAFFEQDFHLVAERRTALRSFSERQVTRTVLKSLKHSPGFSNAPREIRAASRQRLLEARLVLNEHRDHQSLAVTVWRRHDQ